MIISIPRERRRHETRVAATPETVKEYVSLGFAVRVEKNAGKLSGFANEAYRQAGAEIIEDPVGAVPDGRPIEYLFQKDLRRHIPISHLMVCLVC